MFPASHYNEKARWALDWKGLAHQRVSHLPGPHMVSIRRLSGQSQVPVLIMDGRVISGSAQILDSLERAFPARPLYPEDPAQREQALAVQRRFDDEVGPAVRTAVFSVLVPEPDFLCATFSRTQPAWRQAVYRAAFPVMKPMVAKANGVNPESVERAVARTERALDETAHMIGPSGQLVGPRFSVADLTVAALLAPLVPLSHPDMAPPQPIPARVAEFHARWEKHEAVRWVREQYATHRPASCAVPA